MFEDRQRFILSPEVYRQAIDNETVLLDMDSQSYYGLNDVGGELLDILENGADLQGILDRLLKLYDVEKKILKHDVIGLLEELIATGIVQKVR